MKEGAEKDRFLINQILRYIDQCLSHSNYPDSESLSKAIDDFTIVQRDLEQIGEGVKALSNDGKDFLRKNDTPVEAIVGFRNHLAHPYFDFDPGFVFPVCKNNIVPLRKALFSYLMTLPENK